MPKLHAFLDQTGVMYQDYPSGRDTGITDPEGIKTQLSPEDGWSFLNTPNFPVEAVAMEDAPIFRPTGFDHLLLNVTNVEKSAAFYQRFLGMPAECSAGRLWFQTGASRVGLMETPRGESPGVHHFCISAAGFDYNTAVRKLQQLGAAVESTDEKGLVQFRDPDGLRIQVGS